MSESNSIRIPLMIDAAGFIILAVTMAVQWGKNDERLRALERQMVDMRSAQITEGRIVRIEEKQTYLVDRVNETNALLREYIQEQRKANGARR